MKRTLLLLFTLVVATMSLEDIVENLASRLGMNREEVQTCFVKTNITLEDIMKFDEIFEDHLQTEEFNDEVLKMGCFITCLGQRKGVMTGTHINVDRIKEMLFSKKKIKPDELTKAFQVIDSCANRVKGKTNECEVGLRYLTCCVQEMERLIRKNNNATDE